MKRNDTEALTLNVDGRESNTNNLSERDLFLKLSDDKCFTVRYQIAKNPDTPVGILQILAEDNNPGVAENLSTPVDILRTLAKINDQDVKEGLAKNPNTPEEILESLIEYKWLDSRSRWLTSLALKNPNTPANLLEKLGPQWEGLNLMFPIAVALNPGISEELLLKIVEKMSVNYTCANADGKRKILKNALLNPVIPEEVLRHFSETSEPDILWAVAMNKKTPKDVLVTISKTVRSHSNRYIRNDCWKILGGLAENINTPIETLYKLSRLRGEHGYLEYALANNPNTPRDILEDIFLNEADTMFIRQSALENTNFSSKLILGKMAKSKNSYLRWAAAMNPNLPEKFLVRLSNDTNSDVKKASTRNPNMPLSNLAILADDADRRVREEVAEHLRIKNKK